MWTTQNYTMNECSKRSSDTYVSAVLFRYTLSIDVLESYIKNAINKHSPNRNNTLEYFYLTTHICSHHMTKALDIQNVVLVHVMCKQCSPSAQQLYFTVHDVQLSCAITQPLLPHQWRVHQCLLTSRFIVPSIPWGVSAPGGKMRKQLFKDHNFLNNSPIFIIESSTFNIFAFQKALQTIHFNLKNCFGFVERYLTP